jgi:hypothetical protein
MNARPSFDRSPTRDSERNERVELIALCEEAWDRGGRLDLLGGFELITVPDLPCFYRASKVVVRMRFWPDEFGPHYFALHCLEAQGRHLINPPSGPFYVEPAEKDRAAAFNLIVTLPELPLTQPGEHHFHFHLDGRLLARLPFQVREWELPARAPARGDAGRGDTLRFSI